MDLTRCKLCKFIVVPTSVARRLHSYKDARGPSTKLGTIYREGYPVTLQKRPLPRHLGICFCISRHFLVPSVQQKSRGL